MWFLSILNFISGSIVFAFGLYILFLNKKASLNIVFFIYSIVVAFLSFVYYNFYQAYNLEIAQFWYKFLLIWPLVVTLSFHIILLFTKSGVKIFWQIILHLCGFFFIIYKYFFAKIDVYFKKVGTIWVYTVNAHFSFINLLFILWSIILQILSLYYIFKYFINTKSKKSRKIAIIIFFGVLIPFIYGFLKGVLQNSAKLVIIDFNIPLYAFGAIVLGYGISKYGLFKVTLKDKLIDIFNNSNILFVIVLNEKVSFINNYTKNLLKITNKKIENLNVLDFVEKEKYFQIREQILKIGKNGRSNLIEIKVFDSDRKEHYVIFNVTKLFDEMNEVDYHILIGNDITYQKEIEKHLIKAKELAEISDIAKQNFLHNLHHEIKTPLTSIIGFSDFLLKNIKDREYLKEIKIINNSGKILYEYFQNLIEITSLDFKKIRKDIFSLSDIINDIKKTYNFLAVSKNIVFSIKIEENVKPLFDQLLINDYLKVKQVLNLVLNNSFKFISKKPEVLLKIEKVKEDKKTVLILFKIIDNGIGIEKKKIEEIGNLFVLGENVMNKNYRGMGLGLYIVNKILSQLNGQIKIESEFHKGTTVSIIIPFTKVEL